MGALLSRSPSSSKKVYTAPLQDLARFAVLVWQASRGVLRNLRLPAGFHAQWWLAVCGEGPSVAIWHFADLEQQQRQRQGLLDMLANGPDMLRCCMPGGSGVYVANGNVQQDGGSLQLQSSSSHGSGGGLLIKNGGLQQRAGNISCQKCRAKKDGGCLAVEGAVEGTGMVGMDSNGSITAQNCVATSGRTVTRYSLFSKLTAGID